MALAFDAISESANFTADTTFSHNPVGTPRGVIVGIVQNGSQDDEVDSVTYGGAALTLIADSVGQDTSVELMRSELWFLGASVPTSDPATVAVNETGGTTKKAWCVTLTAAGDVEVEDAGNTGQNQDDPSVALTTDEVTWAMGLLISGLGVVGDLTAPAGWTIRDNVDFGQQTAAVMTIDSPDAGGGVTVQFITDGSDDVAMSAVAVREVASVTAYEIDAQPGGYTLTGTAASPVAARIVNAAAGTIAVTGAAASVPAGRMVNAAAGVYAVTGNAAGTAATRLLNAAAGSYALTGSESGLAKGYSFNADPGSYTITGTAAGTVATRTINAAAGSYSVTGAEADLVYTPVAGEFVLNAESGSYTVSGAAASPVAARLFTASPGSYVLTGSQAGTAAGRTVTAAPGSYALTGVAAGLTATRAVVAAPGSYVITGTVAGLAATSDIRIGFFDVPSPAGGIDTVGPEAGSFGRPGAGGGQFGPPTPEQQVIP